MTHKALNRIKGVLRNYLDSSDYESFQYGAPGTDVCQQFLMERLSAQDYHGIIGIESHSENCIFYVVRLELKCDRPGIRQMITGCVLWNGVPGGTSVSHIQIL